MDNGRTNDGDFTRELKSRNAGSCWLSNGRAINDHHHPRVEDRLSRRRKIFIFRQSILPAAAFVIPA